MRGQSLLELNKTRVLRQKKSIVKWMIIKQDGTKVAPEASVEDRTQLESSYQSKTKPHIPPSVSFPASSSTP